MPACGTKRQFARCKAIFGVGVKPTCRLNARTSRFDPMPRVGPAVDLDQLGTLHSPLRGHYFLGSRDAGFVITLNRDWSVGHSLLGRSSQ